MWRQAVLLVPLLAALGVETLALRGGGVVGFGILALATVVLIGVVARVTLDRAGLVCAYGAALFIPLYGVGGHLRPGDLLLPVAILLFLFTQAARPWPSVPVWVWVLTVGILVVGALHEIAPTDAAYLGARTVVDAAGRLGAEPQTNLGVAFRFLVSIPGIPLVFALAAQRDPRAPRRIAAAFAIGAAISGLVAFLTASGLGGLTSALGATSEGTRQGGLSGHPNFLGAATALAFPFALHMAVVGRVPARILGGVLAVCIATGAYECGSRGGVAALLVGTVAYTVLEPRLRRYHSAIGVVVTAVAVFSFVIFPSLGDAILQNTRLGPDATPANGSDMVRELVGQQGWRDFNYSPFDGVGLQISAEAHNSYLQAMAAGGLILLAAYLALVVGSLWTTITLRRSDSLAIALTASLLAATLYNGLENTLTYRFVYVPVGIAAALWYLHVRREQDSDLELLLPAGAPDDLSRSDPHP